MSLACMFDGQKFQFTRVCVCMSSALGMHEKIFAWKWSLMQIYAHTHDTHCWINEIGSMLNWALKFDIIAFNYVWLNFKNCAQVKMSKNYHFCPKQGLGTEWCCSFHLFLSQRKLPGLDNWWKTVSCCV
jgi:hypothetical protein